MESENKYDEVLEKAREIYPRVSWEIKESLQSVFGIENLEPQVNTWVDLVKAGKAEFANITTHVEALQVPFDKSEQVVAAMEAAWRIAQLIEAAYGGMVTNEEWDDRDKWKWIIRPTTKTKFCGEDAELKVCQVSNRSKYRLIAFHVRADAERFLKHNYNLICDYYMLPRKDAEYAAQEVKKCLERVADVLYGKTMI